MFGEGLLVEVTYIRSDRGDTPPLCKIEKSERGRRGLPKTCHRILEDVITVRSTIVDRVITLFFLFFWKKKINSNFPVGPVVKTPCLHCRRHGFNSWWGKLSIMIPHDDSCGQKIK